MRSVEKLRLAALAAAASLALCAQHAAAVVSVNLQFNGSGNTLAATGFQNVYSLTPSGFNVTGGRLVMQTLPGDTFGDYENDPDSADNMFYSTIDPLGRTVAETRFTVTDLNVNFHGGGLWMGTDQDHYVRAGIINNTFEGGGIAFESLRENEDRWPGASIPGPGDDIRGVQYAIPGASSPQAEPINAIIRIIRNQNNARTFLSVDGGTTFVQAGGPGAGTLNNYRHDSVATSLTDPGISGVGNTVENTAEHPAGFKVGVYAFGGPDGSFPATFSFDSMTADSYLLGDFNSDRTVNIGDFSLLGANFNQPGVWETGDANEDGTVNIGDFSLLAANFNRSAPLPRAGAVPEPLTGTAAVALLALLARRPRTSV